MKRNALQIVFTIIICFIFSAAILAQNEYRYFDTAETRSDNLVITILHPSNITIRSIVALQEEGLFPTENVTVVGVYHKDELTNYRASHNYVQSNNLDWFKFHEVKGPLNKDVLFQKNVCSADFANIFAKSDGIIFFGGADITPNIYGEKTSLFTRLGTPYRHFIEISFVFHLLGGSQDKEFVGFLEKNPDFPILAICLGSQTLNVGTGGTLIQDIWFEKYGKKYYEEVVALGREKWHTNPLSRLYPQEHLFGYNLHRIKFSNNSKYVKDFGYSENDRPYIISAHHQSMKKLGKDIIITATSLDGKVVETIEHKRFPNMLGTQFHPDFTVLWNSTRQFKISPDDEETSVRSFMETHPPSFELNRKIWLWFIEKVQEFNSKM